MTRRALCFTAFWCLRYPSCIWLHCVRCLRTAHLVPAYLKVAMIVITCITNEQFIASHQALLHHDVLAKKDLLSWSHCMDLPTPRRGDYPMVGPVLLFLKRLLSFSIRRRSQKGKPSANASEPEPLHVAWPLFSSSPPLKDNITRRESL